MTLASASGDPTEVEKTDSAHMGDVVATDSAGRAQLDYPDGSLTRLGPDTTLTVDVLDSAEAQRTALSLDVGQSWHRVQKLVAEKAQYEVSTPVGVAAVKGTAFEVDCTAEPACTITVIEGVVEFTATDGSVFEVDPYQRLVVPNPDGGDPVVTVAPVAVVQADDWISGNIDADEITEEIPVEAESLAGEWALTYTYTSVSGFLAEHEASGQGTWTFGEATCSPVCSFPVDTGWGTGFIVKLTDAGFSGATGPLKTTCLNTDTGQQVDDAYDYSIDIAADSADGDVIAGTLVWHYTYNGKPSGYCTYGEEPFEEAADITLTRE